MPHSAKPFIAQHYQTQKIHPFLTVILLFNVSLFLICSFLHPLRSTLRTTTNEPLT
ncbi:hypothetical protein BDW66DRAFT_128258 [Aspergillus desertorum]